jgi:hypothetical protein
VSQYVALSQVPELKNISNPTSAPATEEKKEDDVAEAEL